jgi:hypothetical protein
MIQWIITLIIVVAALVYWGYRIYKYFFSKPENKSDCDGCSADCKSCSMNIEKQV